MNNMGNCLPQEDRTIEALLFDARTSGNWSFVEHFMLGTASSALPAANETTEV